MECEYGTADRYPCENVDLLSHLSIDAVGGETDAQLNDVWGWTDPETGTEYALVGRTDGVAFVDVSTPTEPIYVGELPPHSQPSTWRDMKVYDDHAFIVSEASEHGMQVFDLTQLRTVESDERPVTFNETAHYDGIKTAHNLAINTETGFAYVVGGGAADDTTKTCGGGLHMVDVQNPTTPVFAGCFADPSTGRVGTGYTHDAQCVIYEGPDTDYQGRELCFNANETALNIADVANKDDPETIANATYPQIGYVHQAWLTEDHRYLYVDDEFDEQQNNGIDRTRTLVFDVTDLDSPELAETHLGPTGAIDHNQYIEGSFAYQANYESGLRVLDVADPENPEEVAYFDTYPNSNDASFHGAWSTYPFFERNIVLVSSIGEGFFVVELTASPILSVTGTRREQGALVEWTLSASAQTDEMKVEHRPPGSSAWRVAETVEPNSGSGIQNYERSFEDLGLGTHQFRIRHLSTADAVHTSRIVTVKILPSEPYAAEGPAPNPIRGRAHFTLTLRKPQPLHVALYDALGRRVQLLHDGEVEAGVVHRFQIRAAQRASGTYFLRVQGESIQLLRKVVVAR